MVDTRDQERQMGKGNRQKLGQKLKSPPRGRDGQLVDLVAQLQQVETGF